MSVAFIPPCDFGRYRIERELGGGGCGAVYLAWDTQLGRNIALKVPHPDRADDVKVIKRFQRESHVAATINHPHVCPVLDVGEHDGIIFLTMPLIEGTPLSRLIAPDRPWPAPEAAEPVRKLALALDVMHRAGALHRDLKPDNVMLKGGQEPMIMDFGLARSVNEQERLTLKGEFLGTPAYMSPEQVYADPEAIGPACDIYALGVIFYELLTGQVPFTGNLRQMFMQITQVPARKPLELRAGLDPALDAICPKAMAKKASDRYASMAEFAAILEDYLHHDQKVRQEQERRLREAEKQVLRQADLQVKQEYGLRLDAERRLQELTASQEALHRLCDELKATVARERSLRQDAERHAAELLQRLEEASLVAEHVAAVERVAAPLRSMSQRNALEAIAEEVCRRHDTAGPTSTTTDVKHGQREADTCFDILVRNAQAIVAAEERRRPSIYETVPDRKDSVHITVVDTRKGGQLPRRAAVPPPGEEPETLRKWLLDDPDNRRLRAHYLEVRTPELRAADRGLVRRWRGGIFRWAGLVAGMFIGELVLGAALVTAGLWVGDVAGGLVGGAVAAVVCAVLGWKLITVVAGAVDSAADWAELGPLSRDAYELSLEQARQKYLGR